MTATRESIDRTDLTQATLSELKEQAITLHNGELIIQIRAGHISAVLKHNGIIELWSAGAGDITRDDMPMFRDTWFSEDHFPAWR
jgi:hypothetical protein